MKLKIGFQLIPAVLAFPPTSPNVDRALKLLHRFVSKDGTDTTQASAWIHNVSRSRVDSDTPEAQGIQDVWGQSVAKVLNRLIDSFGEDSYAEGINGSLFRFVLQALDQILRVALAKNDWIDNRA